MIDVRLRPKEYVVENAVTFDPEARNHMFVPVEGVAQIVLLLDSLGMRGAVS